MPMPINYTNSPLISNKYKCQSKHSLILIRLRGMEDSIEPPDKSPKTTKALKAKHYNY
jgi:hypothetical protein